ncbi:MAG: RNA-guided endonuclease TnpB family protein, partial [Nanoarchaeota archaeon]
MRSIATIKLKIKNNPMLIETMKQYREAVSYIADKGFNNKICNRYKLHHLVYYEVRDKFNLPSQFIINAIRVASQALKSIKTSKGSKPRFKEFLPLDFDRRTFTFNSDKVRLTTIKGRIDIPVEIPEYYWKYLDWSYQTAKIIMDKKGRLFIHIAFRRDINIPTSTGKAIGIDLGIINIAVTSDKRFFNSRQIKKKRIMFKRLRTKLQAKGTKSARRLLKKLSSKEKRFMTWVNHNISKEIVSSLEPGDTIVMENLKGIRKIKRGRKINFWLHGWSFYQLQRFIEYKSIREGIKVIKVNPFQTSITCSRCGNIGNRVEGFFKCIHCGYSLNADLNVSFNLAKHNSMPDCVL